MGNVMVIPARRQVGNTVKQSAQKKLRVAAYCRVSTDSEEQETSYEAQVTHYTEYLQNNPEWELAGIFADDDISGTKRQEHTCLFRERSHQHAGRKGRSANHDHGEPCPAGKPVNESEH